MLLAVVRLILVYVSGGEANLLVIVVFVHIKITVVVISAIVLVIITVIIPKDFEVYAVVTMVVAFLTSMLAL